MAKKTTKKENSEYVLNLKKSKRNFLKLPKNIDWNTFLNGGLTIDTNKTVELKVPKNIDWNLDLKAYSKPWADQPHTEAEANETLEEANIKAKLGEVYSFPLTIKSKKGERTVDTQIKVLWYNKDKNVIVTIGPDYKNPTENRVYNFDVDTFKKHCKRVPEKDITNKIKITFTWKEQAKAGKPNKPMSPEDFFRVPEQPKTTPEPTKKKSKQSKTRG